MIPNHPPPQPPVNRITIPALQLRAGDVLTQATHYSARYLGEVRSTQLRLSEFLTRIRVEMDGLPTVEFTPSEIVEVIR